MSSKIDFIFYLHMDVNKIKDITQEILAGNYPDLLDQNIGCEHVPASEEEKEFFKNNIEPRDFDDYPPKLADAYFKLQTMIDNLNENDDILGKYREKLHNIDNLNDDEIQKLVGDMEYDITDLETELGPESVLENDE